MNSTAMLIAVCATSEEAIEDPMNIDPEQLQYGMYGLVVPIKVKT